MNYGPDYSGSFVDSQWLIPWVNCAVIITVCTRVADPAGFDAGAERRLSLCRKLVADPAAGGRRGNC